jgi:hypothetical protein
MLVLAGWRLRGSAGFCFGELPEAEALASVSQKYPAVFDHLLPYHKKAKKRYDKGDYWWELRACDYYEEFEKPKIFFPDISNQANFTLDKDLGCFSANTTYFIANGEIVLLGILNSKVLFFYYRNAFSIYRGGYLRFFTQYLEQLPIAVSGSNPLENEVMEKTNELIELKKSAPGADTTALEAEIDQLVYELYGLTEEEIAIIEEAVKG